MKMKKIVVFIGTLGLATSLFASADAQKIFDAKCAMCHIKTMPTNRANMVAPALMGVMRHVKMVYPNKEDAVDFMVDYVQNPTKEKAICMPQKIARFGLMPSQKGNITPEELKEVTEWMFDNLPPANFRGRGMGKGMQNRPTFSSFDANGDGKITPEEFTAFQNARMRSRMGQIGNQNSMMGMGRNRSTFADFDLNKDDVITKEELLKERAKKQQAKASAGYPMRNASNAPSFESIDKDSNGKITSEEFDSRFK